MNNRQARLLEEVLKAPGNDNCADCHAPAPRWASVNLGIFLCVQCASVHRKMGTHTSRVKSVTLDTWTREQVDAMRQMGNVKANAEWNPNERLHPPPTNTGDVERDSDLEKYIRMKYEAGRFKRDVVPPPPQVRERARETAPELRDIIASRPKSTPLPDLPPEATPVFGRGTAPPRMRPVPTRQAPEPPVELVQTAAASTSTLPLQMAYSAVPHEHMLAPQQQQYMQQQYARQDPQAFQQQTFQGQAFQQQAYAQLHGQPFPQSPPLTTSYGMASYQQQSMQPMQQSLQPMQQPMQQPFQYQPQGFQQFQPQPSFQPQSQFQPHGYQTPNGSIYGGQLFNSLAAMPQQQSGFPQGMMPPR